MNTPCAACLAGPTGIEGHAGLGVSSMSADHITLNCKACATTWSRTYPSSGAYTWTPLTTVADGNGLLVPANSPGNPATGARPPSTYPTDQWASLLRSGLRPRPIPDGPLPAALPPASPEPSAPRPNPSLVDID